LHAVYCTGLYAEAVEKWSDNQWIWKFMHDRTLLLSIDYWLHLWPGGYRLEFWKNLSMESINLHLGSGWLKFKGHSHLTVSNSPLVVNTLGIAEAYARDCCQSASTGILRAASVKFVYASSSV
jgi:hypothetical protein